MQIPFVGGAYTSRSLNLNAQTCINLFPIVSVSNQQEAKSVTALFGTPGLVKLTQPVIGDNPVRAVYRAGAYLYTVIGPRVYRIDLVGNATYLGLLATSTGFVSITDDSLYVVIADGTSWVFRVEIATDNFAQILAITVPVCYVTFQDGFVIAVAKDTRTFYVSGSYDTATWDAAQCAVVSARSQNLLAAISNINDLWFFGEVATVVYYNSGGSFPFDPISGALIDVGCGAIGSPCKINGLMYWLSDDGRIVRNNGYTSVTPISTPEIDYIISTYATISDAIGYTVSVDGHLWYVLTFPTQDKTWVYDISTGYFFEWQSYESITVPWGRHRSNCAARFGRNWIVGDYANGTLYTLSMSVYKDDAWTIRRERTTQTIGKENLNIIHHSVEIEFESGVGLTGGVVGSDPKAVLEWSNNGGHTWSNQHWVSIDHSGSIGKIGKYSAKVQWNRLGQGRDRVYRLTISDPVKVVILGANSTLEACTS